MTETTPATTLDLDSTVTRDEYKASITAMHNFMERELTSRHNWCEGRWGYFTALIPELEWDESYDHRPIMNFNLVPEEADYAARLKTMRGKLLWYTNAHTIVLREANEVFRAGGLPEYPDKNGSIRVNVAIPPIQFNLATTDPEAAQEWGQHSLADFVTRMLDGKGRQDSDLYVPGSAVIQNVRYSYQVEVGRPGAPIIDEADMICPSDG